MQGAYFSSYNNATMADENIIDPLNTITTDDMLATMPTAATRVFSIYELCEAIILASHSKDILAFARTNKACHHVVTTSTAIIKRPVASDFFYTAAPQADFMLGTYVTYLPDSINAHVFISSKLQIRVLRLSANGIVMVKVFYDSNRTSLHQPGRRFHTPLQKFVSDVDDIPGLLDTDRAALQESWIRPFVISTQKIRDLPFMERVVAGLYKMSGNWAGDRQLRSRKRPAPDK